MAARRTLAVLLTSLALIAARQDDPDLEGYRTTKTAIVGKLGPAKITSVRGGFLGVELVVNDGPGLLIRAVAPDSPAEKSGLRAGDVLLRYDNRPVGRSSDLQEKILGTEPDTEIDLVVIRDEERMSVKVTLTSVTNPKTRGTSSSSRPYLGVQTREDEDKGLVVRRVNRDTAAEAAGLKVGDILLEIEGESLKSSQDLNSVLGDRKVGDEIAMVVLRKEDKLTLKATLKPRGSTRGGMTIWRKNTYRLAVIPVDHADVKHNEKITTEEWTKAFFSTKEYTDKSATGRKVYGSINDYYQEVSCGEVSMVGKVFEPVELSKKRSEYGQGTSGRSKSTYLREALDLLIEREGEDALKDIDGLCFIYSGRRARATRGSLYWPHRASVTHKGKRWPYFITDEGGRTMANISVFCHEFGHMLGLPDLYARPEQPGSEGLGQWCAMSNQAGRGRPQHFSAWCKIRLGWLKPVTIDPRVRQKLILSPVNGSKTECYKVLVKADGSEYFLLENRRKTGFDTSLPQEGLLIWRVVKGRPVLEESHGIAGPSGPGSFTKSVPYPSDSNTSFTPHTVPSSKSQLGGGNEVHITNIRQLSDGRIAFHIGYRFR